MISHSCKVRGAGRGGVISHSCIRGGVSACGISQSFRVRDPVGDGVLVTVVAK